jgi:hypothetical protein
LSITSFVVPVSVADRAPATKVALLAIFEYSPPDGPLTPDVLANSLTVKLPENAIPFNVPAHSRRGSCCEYGDQAGSSRCLTGDTLHGSVPRVTPPGGAIYVPNANELNFHNFNYYCASMCNQFLRQTAYSAVS